MSGAHTQVWIHVPVRSKPTKMQPQAETFAESVPVWQPLLSGGHITSGKTLNPGLRESPQINSQEKEQRGENTPSPPHTHQENTPPTSPQREQGLLTP